MGKRRRKKEADLAKIIVALAIFSGLYLWRYSGVLGMIIVVAVPLVIGVIFIIKMTSAPKENFPPPLRQVQVDSTRPVQIDSQKWSPELLRCLDWKRFEELCAAYFCAAGYHATVTSLGADGGIDVMLYGKDDPSLNIGIVQCKAWSGKLIGVKEVREFLGVMTSIGSPLGIYITTSDYTPDAREFAQRNNIQLLGAEQLLDEIGKLPAESRSNLLQTTTAGDYTTPSCPSCGTKLVLRTSRNFVGGNPKFWSCRNFPRCRYTMRVKAA